ncbi:replication factor A [Halobacteriales archaeon QS_8_69_26]|nr:MAG: replication factor A [Halobacteriales archaeon QS_8_69_26]
MELDQHAEELASDLGVDREEVRADLENLVSYDVPIDEAKQSLRRKYGDGGGGDDAAPSQVDVADVDTDDGNVSVTATVLTVGKRSIRYQGDDLVIYEGELADATGKIDYTAWQDFGLEPGDTVTVGNAGVREWEGRPELNLSEGTTVGYADADLDVPDEVGGDADLVDLRAGDRGVNVEVTVLEVEERTIDGRDGPTDILDGVVADETGRLPLTDWDPHDAIGEGESVRIENAYVREFRGVPSLNVTEFSTVERLDRAIEVGDEAPRMTVAAAVDTGGVYDVTVAGNVIEVRDGSGLIERCPECGRVIQNGQCRTHGDVEGEDDLRVKAILDDGTATLTVVLDRGLTEDVYGGTLEDALDEARDAMDREVVAETIADAVVGREFTVRGHLSVDEYGATLDASEFAETADPPADRAKELLAAVDAPAGDGGAAGGG